MAKRYSLLFLVFFLSGCDSGPVGWWKKVNSKAHHLFSVEAKYEALREEHDALKKRHLQMESELASLKNQVETKELTHLNLEATGSEVGRHLASISYTPPKGLAPEEILTLGIQHLKEQRFAEAAVTFDHLLEQPEAAALVDAKVHYNAGVAWFQVKNFKKAKEHLDLAKSGASDEQKEKIRKKVDLWMRVIDRKLASVPQGE
jgi:hypothetical protein